jgi:hypothetical protein
MNKNFANKIINYFEAKGYEVEHWISKDKGGHTVETIPDSLINAGEFVINDDACISTSSANYRAVYLEGNEDDGDEVILCKDYLVIKIPHRKTHK